MWRCIGQYDRDSYVADIKLAPEDLLINSNRDPNVNPIAHAYGSTFKYGGIYIKARGGWDVISLYDLGRRYFDNQIFYLWRWNNDGDNNIFNKLIQNDVEILPEKDRKIFLVGEDKKMVFGKPIRKLPTNKHFATRLPLP